MGNLKRNIIITIAVFLTLILFVVVDCNLEKKNTVSLSFSAESGFYEEPFYLEIECGPDVQIYYTLDGSIPTRESIPYQEPIYLEDASEHPNVYCDRNDFTELYQEEFAEWQNLDYNRDEKLISKVPDYPVDKCNIVRAAAFERDGDCVGSISGVYYVGFAGKSSGYRSGYVASIIADPDDLFGYEKGIFVTGQTFDEFLENGTEQEKNEIYNPWPANFTNRGREWERPAFVEIFDETGQRVLAQNCGIRIQGGGSRRYVQKSIGCYARKEYSGNSKFEGDLFQTGILPHKFCFFSGGDDYLYKIEDFMAQTMEQELNFATMDFIPCSVFLNGEYWGFYYITEAYNAEYISGHYQVDAENVIMLKDYEVVEGDNGDELLYERMREYIANADMTVPENYEKACDLIDMSSFIDYYAAQAYIGRASDWPSGNWAVWRTRKKEGSSYGDCRWRWMLFDVNSNEFWDTPENPIEYILQNDEMFSSLYCNDDFKRQFSERILYIGNVLYSKEKCEEFLSFYETDLQALICRNNLRFLGEIREESFSENLQKVTDFFASRYDVIWNSLCESIGEDWLVENGIQK